MEAPPSDPLPPVAPPAGELDPVRTWPSWLALICILPWTLVMSSLALFLAAWIFAPSGTFDSASGFQDWLFGLADEGASGILIMFVPGSMVFLLTSLLAAYLSKQPLARRLGFVRPTLSTPTWMLLALGAPVVQLVSFAVVGLLFDLGEPSEHIQQLAEMFSQRTGVALVVLIVAASVLPGISEEAFFRGFLRVGLARRYGFGAVVFLPALMFAAVHLDPMHVMGVLPLGLWFGLLAWWSGSTLPAVLAHVVNNLFAILSAQLDDPTAQADVASGLDQITSSHSAVLVGYGVCLVLLLAGAARLGGERGRRTR